MIMDDLISSCKEALPPLGEGQPISGVTILELRLYSCRYVVGADDDLGAIFCGVTTFKGSYCEAHHKICYKGLPRKANEEIRSK
jgi:hypothetical protein